MSRKQTLLRQRRALKDTQDFWQPLLELFCVADDVFTEEQALNKEYAYQTVGRLYRQWKVTRLSLDPDFDPKDYEKRPRGSSPSVIGRPTFFTATTPTLGKSRKTKSSNENGKRSRSVVNAK
jgi:hypothetical protein